MNNPELRASTVKHVTEYIDERIAGSNKGESAVRAGYSEQTARTPSLIEQTKAYAVVITQVLERNAGSLHATMHEMHEVVTSEPVNWEKALIISKVAEKLANIQDKLTPKITVKETKNADGTTTRTSWGTGSLQQSE